MYEGDSAVNLTAESPQGWGPIWYQPRWTTSVVQPPIRVSHQVRERSSRNSHNNCDIQNRSSEGNAYKISNTATHSNYSKTWEHLPVHECPPDLPFSLILVLIMIKASVKFDEIPRASHCQSSSAFTSMIIFLFFFCLFFNNGDPNNIRILLHWLWVWGHVVPTFLSFLL